MAAGGILQLHLAAVQAGDSRRAPHHFRDLFKVLDVLPEEVSVLVHFIGREQVSELMPERLLGLYPEDGLRRPVVSTHHTIHAEGNDAFCGMLDDVGELLLAGALLCLRLEKNFGTWYREFRPIYGPFEAGLDRFIKLDKPDFIGRAAALKEKQDGPKRQRVFMVVDALDADVMGDEPIWVDGKVAGWVTSGGFGHFVNQSLAQGYLPTELVKPGVQLEIEILGERRPARLQMDPPFDPEAKRMRM